jgi:hypothetical protein
MLPLANLVLKLLPLQLDGLLQDLALGFDISHAVLEDILGQ